jgi:hypothetical protein
MTQFEFESGDKFVAGGGALGLFAVRAAAQ